MADIFISDSTAGYDHGDKILSAINFGYGGDITDRITLRKNSSYNITQVEMDMQEAYDSGYIAFIYSGSGPSNTTIAKAKLYQPTMQCFFPLGSNSYTELNLLPNEISSIICSGAGDTQNRTGYGNGLEFWDFDSFDDIYFESSFSNGVILGKLLKIKEDKNCSWWKARYIARQTAETFYFDTSTLLATNCTNFSPTGSIVWNNINNVLVKDGNYTSGVINASFDDLQTTVFLQLDHFNFNIPPNSVITGLSVNIKKHAAWKSLPDLYIADNSLKFKKPDLTFSNDKADTVTYWEETDQIIQYGADEDLWGLQLLPSDVNDDNFILFFSAKIKGYHLADPPETAFIDYIEVIIYYTVDNIGQWSIYDGYGKININNAITYNGIIPRNPFVDDGKKSRLFLI